MSGRRGSRSRQGMVLIVVLVVVVLLSLAAYAFVDRMASEQKAVHLHAARVQSRLAAESGAEYVVGRLASAEGAGQVLTVDLSDNAASFCAVRLLPPEGMTGDESTPASRFTVIAPPLEAEAAGPRFGLLDESARLNLHALVAWDAEEPGAGRRALLALPEMTPAIADRILDYVDSDAEPREQGFERPGPGPATIEGLLAIEGVTPALLLGSDHDRNGRLDALESDASRPDAATMDSPAPLPPSGWSTWLTLRSAESALAADGSERIDLNSDNLTTLHEALAERFDETVADFVVAYRQFATPHAVASVGGRSASASPADAAPRRRTPRLNDHRSGSAASSPEKRTPQPGSSGRGRKEKKSESPRRPSRPAEVDPASAPPAVRLRSAYDLVDAVVQMPATGQRAAGERKSPWRLDDRDADAAFSRFLDGTTTQAGPRVGRVNVLQAPRVVLQAVGLEPRVVDAVLEGRGGPSSVRSDRETLLWLVREKHLDLPELQRIAPRLTTRGHVVTAQVIGFVDPSGPVERYELTVDATVRPPRRLSWKSLAPLGRGYPASVLDPLAQPAPAASRPSAPPSLAATP